MNEQEYRPIKVCPICQKVDIDPDTHECDPDRLMREDNNWK